MWWNWLQLPTIPGCVGCGVWILGNADQYVTFVFSSTNQVLLTRLMAALMSRLEHSRRHNTQQSNCCTLPVTKSVSHVLKPAQTRLERKPLTSINGWIPAGELGCRYAVFGLNDAALVSARYKMELITVRRKTGLCRRRSSWAGCCCLGWGSGGHGRSRSGSWHIGRNCAIHTVVIVGHEAGTLDTGIKSLKIIDANAPTLAEGVARFASTCSNGKGARNAAVV